MNKNQYKFLKKLDKSCTINWNDLSETERSMQRYLQSLGYIHQTITNKTPQYSVTQKGKDEMFQFTLKYYRWWIPVIISLAALTVSIATAILK